MAITAYVESEKRADFRAGQIAAVVANVNRRKNRKPYRPADFFASLKPARREQTPEEQRAALLGIARMSGAVIKRVPLEQLREMTRE